MPARGRQTSLNIGSLSLAGSRPAIFSCTFLGCGVSLDVSTVLPNRRGVLKNKTPLILLLLLFLAFALWAQKDQPPAKTPTPESKIPPEEAAKVNPVKPTAESLAKGKKMYGIDCRMCHETSANGKGDTQRDFKTIPH